MMQGAAKTGWRKLFLWGLLAVVIAASALAGWFFRPLPLAAAPALESLEASAERGQYLATIGNCAACHTVPGGEPYAGGVRFVTDFGTIFSTNITPDPQHGIGDWDFGQFHRAMTQGIGADGQHLYPAFPYTSFAGMSDADIASLFLFLREVEPAAVGNVANDMSFPFGERGLLHFWKRMFHDADPLVGSTQRSPEWNRGAYLVHSVAHCSECHSPRNLLGGVDQSRSLHGGTYVDQVRNGNYRTWAAVDLTTGPRGLAHWDVEDFEQYLATGINDHAVIHGPMREVLDATRQLTPADRRAMATYLTETDPSPDRLSLRSLPFGRDEGEVVYTVHCGTCHLPDGNGDPTLGVSLHHNPIVQADDPSSLINVILYGPDLPPPPFSVGRSQMKPFGKRLSDEDIAALATFLRSNFGNNAGSVGAAQVARQR